MLQMSEGGRAITMDLEGPPSGDDGCDCPLCHEAFPRTDEESTARVRRHAEAGQAWAQEELAFRLMNTDTGSCSSRPPDHAQAFYWRNLAAASGNAFAQTNLGVLYYHGDPEVGIFPNIVTAKDYFFVAAAQGSAAAQYSLGEIYCGRWDSTTAEGAAEGPDAAVRWWTLAAAQGSAKAQLRLAHGWAHGHGDLRPASKEKALYWSHQAANQGLAEAQYWTARFLFASAEEQCLGRADLPGCSVVPKALYWAKLAAGNGHPNARGYALQLDQSVQSHCAHCFADGNSLFVCGNCGGAAYCDQDCQVSAEIVVR